MSCTEFVEFARRSAGPVGCVRVCGVTKGAVRLAGRPRAGGRAGCLLRRYAPPARTVHDWPRTVTPCAGACPRIAAERSRRLATLPLEIVHYDIIPSGMPLYATSTRPSVPDLLRLQSQSDLFPLPLAAFRFHVHSARFHVHSAEYPPHQLPSTTARPWNVGNQGELETPLTQASRLAPLLLTHASDLCARQDKATSVTP